MMCRTTGNISRCKRVRAFILTQKDPAEVCHPVPNQPPSTESWSSCIGSGFPSIGLLAPKFAVTPMQCPAPHRERGRRTWKVNGRMRDGRICRSALRSSLAVRARRCRARRASLHRVLRRGNPQQEHPDGLTGPRPLLTSCAGNDLQCTGRNQPSRISWAMRRTSLRSVLTGIAFPAKAYEHY
jgi:hypothetical protein